MVDKARVTDQMQSAQTKCNQHQNVMGGPKDEAMQSMYQSKATQMRGEDANVGSQRRAQGSAKAVRGVQKMGGAMQIGV